MKVAILDVDYGVNADKYRRAAASWLHWELSGLGAEFVAPSEAESVLVTACDPSQWKDIRSILKRFGVTPVRGNRPQRVYIGGAIGTSPAILDPIADAVCVGEGRTFVRTLMREGHAAIKALPCAWVPGQKRDVIPDTEFPWDVPPIENESGAVNVFVSRGCQKKCLFCQTSWSGPFVQNPTPIADIQKRVLPLGKPIIWGTNDAAALEGFNDLGGTSYFSATYDALEARLREGRGLPEGVRFVRLGVEGVSERLRKLLGKPIPSEGLARVCGALMEQSVSIKWMFIPGLPGEREEDWAELREMVLMLKRYGKRSMCEIDFTAFVPVPAAPLCIAPLTDDYWERFSAFRRWFLTTKAYTRNITILNPSKPPLSLFRAMSAQAATEEQVRQGWFDQDPPNWRIKSPYRDRMRKAFDVYWRKVHAPADGKVGRAPDVGAQEGGTK